MFCYQQNFFNPTKEVDRNVFWALVGAPYTTECIEKYRETGDAAWKKRLPAFIFQATFDVTKSKKGYEGAWRKQAATRPTGLVVMDVDHVENPRETCRGWLTHDAPCLGDRCRELGILLVYVTPSGHGLKVVFKARTVWGNLIDNQHKMAALLGVEVDEACKDASRMSFICRKEDILFINEQELFSYENKEFAEKYNDVYRGGHSQPTLFDTKRRDDSSAEGDGEAAPTAGKGDTVEPRHDSATYHGVRYDKIIEAWLDGKQPKEGDRHNTLLKLATDLRYITDNSAKKMKQVLMSQQWVKDLVDDGDSIDTVIKSAQDYKMYQSIPKRMREVLMKAGVSLQDPADELAGLGGPLPLAAWGDRVAALFGEYPCLREACVGLNPQGYAAALFTSAALLGTDMTRTWYYFYHRPEEQRRLNYCVFIIGDPASGKSFATRLYKLLAAPIKAADKVGYDAINRYKRERQERTTSTKAQKGEALKKPDVIIRDHPARTSNATFIEDMNRAVETVDGQPMHLHMLTFDSELDNATVTQRSGSWIDKQSMELKAFHNEEDGQAYSNLESISGTFNVYWNFIYTGTPLSLGRKVSERNFGTGLATRLAVIPLPPSGFQMMALQRSTKTDHQADETLKTWAYRLDGVHGELPLWPLVEHCWQWTNERMQVAAFNQDKADELLMKRVSYYGVCIAAPFVLMRHWDEWQEKRTFDIDDTDRELCTLALDIQYHCQHHFFGNMARAYFDNMERDEQQNRRRPSKYDQCYAQLPPVFTTEDVVRIYGIEKPNAALTCTRLKKGGYIESIKKGQFRKLKTTIQ